MADEILDYEPVGSSSHFRNECLNNIKRETNSEIDDSDKDPDCEAVSEIEDTSPENNDKNDDPVPTNQNDLLKDERGLQDNKKTLTWKRRRNPENWKCNKRQSFREKGEEYQDIKGNIHPSQSVKKGCLNSCSLKCTSLISEAERVVIHKQFWSLSDPEKSHFYSKYVQRVNAIRKRTTAEISKKMYTFVYYLESNNVKIKVCQLFFLNTLSISQQRIYYFFKCVKNPTTNVPRSPTKGKNVKRVTSEENIQTVKSHIESFPTVDFYYCRSSTNKKYLEAGLSISKMYNLYKEICNGDPVKFNVYSKIFSGHFNISFFKPKKDKCDKCIEYNVNKNPTPDQILQHGKHLRGIEMSRREKNLDKELKKDKTGVITFDLQNVFALPKANTSSFFYKRKLNCYNLTAHCSINGITYCSLWNESISGRAGNDIASALMKILKEVVKDNPSITTLILWSDSCVSQNKNSLMSMAILGFMNSVDSKNVKKIEQKYAEPGHSNLQEVDAVHSAIERYIRNLEIYSPLSLLRVLTNIKFPKIKLKVMQLNKNSDFFNYQLASTSLLFSNILYTKVKHLIYKKGDLFNIYFNYVFDNDTLQMNKILKDRTSINDKTKVEIKCLPTISLLRQEIELNIEKVKDLKSMMPCMPPIDQEYYVTIIGTGPSTSHK